MSAPGGTHLPRAIANAFSRPADYGRLHTASLDDGRPISTIRSDSEAPVSEMVRPAAVRKAPASTSGVATMLADRSRMRRRLTAQASAGATAAATAVMFDTEPLDET